MTNDRIYTLHNHKQSYGGRASVFTSLKASISVEAALAVPVFFFAMLCLIYLLEIMSIQTSVRSGLQYAAKHVMEDAYPAAVIRPGDIEAYIVEEVGADRLERSIIVGGSSGIECRESKMSVRTGIGDLKAVYQIKLPVPMFLIDGIRCEETIKVKAWVGYEKEFLGSEKEDTVYVTENGIVYHRDYHCTYLELSIQMVMRETIEELRNKNGGKYYPCVICGGRGSQVYITDNGNRYHGSLSCSGLKRTVYAIPLSEAIGKGACARCVK